MGTTRQRAVASVSTRPSGRPGDTPTASTPGSAIAPAADAAAPGRSGPGRSGEVAGDREPRTASFVDPRHRHQLSVDRCGAAVAQLEVGGDDRRVDAAKHVNRLPEHLVEHHGLDATMDHAAPALVGGTEVDRHHVPPGERSVRRHRPAQVQPDEVGHAAPEASVVGLPPDPSCSRVGARAGAVGAVHERAG